MAKFMKGKSGNPAGRPKKIMDNDANAKTLLHTHAPALIKKAVSMALKGDPAALKLCLERVAPKVTPVSGLPPLPPIETWQQPGVEITKRYADVINGILAGEISGKQGGELLAALATASENLVDHRSRFGSKAQSRKEMVVYFTCLIRAYADTNQLQKIISLLKSELNSPNSRSKSWDNQSNQQDNITTIESTVKNVPPSPEASLNHRQALIKRPGNFQSLTVPAAL